MIRTNKRLALCLILLIGCLCFIWGNSLLNAAASSTVSDFVGKIMGVLPDSPMAAEYRALAENVLRACEVGVC